MYLKNIEVQGFKSFAQKIDFEFHNGITGIVGPNGSGKSNVADAVRWVLGEQSAKQLRGGNMQDVIFAGTELRKPLSFASVAITLDNSDHALPVDFGEVTVTRRLYRSGESEYLINGTACRLRDINEMFYDTGIGKEGYSIIGQGQIDRILSGKPEERRELFDEAAGIVKFKRRKNATVKKLEDERQNLVRVSDILSEVTRQLGPLKKQAESARIYLARRERQRILDVSLFLSENEKAKSQIEELGGKLAAALAELDGVQKEYDQTKEAFSSLEIELDGLNGQIEAARQKVQESQLKRQDLEGQARILQEQIQAGIRHEDLYRRRFEAILEDEKSKKDQEAALAADLEEVGAQYAKTSRQRASREEKLSDLRDRIEEAASAIEEGKQEVLKLLDKKASTQGKAQRYDAVMEQIGLRKAKLSSRLLGLKAEEESQKKDLAEAQRRYEKVSAMIGQMNQEAGKLKEEIEDLTQTLGKQNEQMQIGEAAFHRESSRLESLRNMAERYDGYGQSIRRVMEQKDRQKGILGVVADLIHVEKKYEIAIETALGGSIQNIVTDREETAKRLIDFLKRNRFGRATFLPLDGLTIRGSFSPPAALEEQGAIGVASALVETGKEYGKLADYLLGRILVVDNIDHALAIARKYRHSLRIVTLEGESLSPGGSMTGGAFKNNSNLLGRRREIEELETSVKTLAGEMETVRAEIAQNRSRRNILRDTLADLNEKLRGQYVAQNTERLRVEAAKEHGDQLAQDLEGLKREEEDIRQDVGKARLENEEVLKEMEASERDERELEEYIGTREGDLEDLEKQQQDLAGEVEDLRIREAELSQKKSFTATSLERVKGELESLEKEQEELTRSLEEGKEERNRKQEDEKRLHEAATAFASCGEEAGKELSDLQGIWSEKNTTYRSFFDKRDELSGRINLLDKESLRLKGQKERLEENQEAQIAYLWEEYEITPAHAKELADPSLDNPREMRKELSAIREEIKSLGPVNVSAIEEFRDLEERHTFLSGQVNDIKQAEANLVDIIKELDEGMRRQFTEKFRLVQAEFDRTFKELFGGGKGSLALEEDVDILEAGILINSQPPGKKLQNMMQLSGGEKALTAIALLFAIQGLKPSPFCLLDEIEAALDDSNVGRFAGYLQKLTKSTQFIVITHRRGTMNAADRLYGITMQEKGVSTLVSVDLVEKELA